MIKIKPLSNYPGQVSNLSNMWRVNIGEAFSPSVSSDIIASKLQESLNEDSLPLAFIALDGDNPVGMVRLSIEADIGHSPYFPWINMLFIDQRYRKRGIGALLLKSIQSEAFRLGFKKLYAAPLSDESHAWLIKKAGWGEVEGAKIEAVDKILTYNLSHADLI